MTSVVWIVVAVAVVILIAAAVLAARRRPRLRELPDEARGRYADEWRRIEALFVDEPRQAVREADRLAVSIHRERGGEVEGGKLPDDLREARRLASGDTGEEEGDRGLGQTESLRRAMVAYQRIVDGSVGVETRRATEARRPEVS